MCHSEQLGSSDECHDMIPLPYPWPLQQHYGRNFPASPLIGVDCNRKLQDALLNDGRMSFFRPCACLSVCLFRYVYLYLCMYVLQVHPGWWCFRWRLVCKLTTIQGYCSWYSIPPPKENNEKNRRILQSRIGSFAYECNVIYDTYTLDCLGRSSITLYAECNHSFPFGNFLESLIINYDLQEANNRDHWGW